jgi:hypothetical protein
MIVSGDTWSTAAVSSTLKPPKKRNSTTRDFRGVHCLKYFQRVVKGDHLTDIPGRKIGNFIQIDAWQSAAALRCHAPARAIEEYAPHHRGRNGKEMGAVLPVDVGDIDHAEPGFMDQGCRLDCTSGALVLHAMTGYATEFPVNPGRELPQCFLVASSPGSQELRRVRVCGRGHKGI